MLMPMGIGVSRKPQKMVWLAESVGLVADTGRTANLAWTDKDITANTSPNAKFAILLLRTNCTAYTSNYAFLQVRKNGDTPTNAPQLMHPSATEIPDRRDLSAIVGLDSGQVFEYKIAVVATGTYDTYIYLLGYIE